MSEWDIVKLFVNRHYSAEEQKSKVRKWKSAEVTLGGKFIIIHLEQPIARKITPPQVYVLSASALNQELL